MVQPQTGAKMASTPSLHIHNLSKMLKNYCMILKLICSITHNAQNRIAKNLGDDICTTAWGTEELKVMDLNHAVVYWLLSLCATGVLRQLQLRAAWCSHHSLALKATTISPRNSTDWASDMTKWCNQTWFSIEQLSPMLLFPKILIKFYNKTFF